MSAANVWEAVVERRSPADGLAQMAVAGGGRILCPDWTELRGGACRISVDPADVLLCAERPGRITARNVLHATVVSARRTREGIFVELEAGFPLVAKITPAARRELGLRPGRGVFALFKAWSVRLEVPPGAPLRFRAEPFVEGRGGSFGPDRVALLREIDRAGSISQAARALGITYRTAWLWTAGMTESVGRPLVARTAGGRGGGGASLTSEGRRLLEGYDAFRRRLESLARH